MYVPLDYTTGTRAEAQFRKGAARLEQTQAEVLMRYLKAAQGCEVASRFGLARVKTVREFQSAVPITSYDAMADDVGRMQAGAERVRFDDPTEGFVQTGGTSGASKVFPRRKLRIGELAGRMIDRGTQVALLAHDHPSLAEGKELVLVGGAPAGQVPFGSAQTYGAVYRASAEVRARMLMDPSWLDVLTDAPTRFYVTCRLALGEDVRELSGLAPALLVLAKTLSVSTETLLRDVRDGVISADLSREERAALPQLPPNPALADELERQAGPSGELTPRIVWPRLSVVRCMMSAALAQNRAAVAAAYGAPLREVGYSSTEAPNLAFPVRDEDMNLVVGIHSAFCEMVDEDDSVHLLHDLCVGHTYRLVLTTAHGLYRYDTHDLLEVTGHDLGGAPVVRFVGRARVHNLMGEKLSETQVTEAVARAASRSVGGPLRQFVFVPRAPRDGVAPHYELRVERGDDPFDPQTLEQALEAELRACNVLYESYRFGGALGHVRVAPVSGEWFAALRAHLETLSQTAKMPVFLLEERLPPVDAGS